MKPTKLLRFILFAIVGYILIKLVFVINPYEHGSHANALFNFFAIIFLTIFAIFIILAAVWAINSFSMRSEDVKKFAYDMWADYINKYKFEEYKTDWVAEFPFLSPFIVKDSAKIIFKDSFQKLIFGKKSSLISFLHAGYKTRLNGTDYYLAAKAFYNEKAAHPTVFLSAVNIVRVSGKKMSNITIVENTIPFDSRNTLNDIDAGEEFKNYKFSGDKNFTIKVLSTLREYFKPNNLNTKFAVRAEGDILLIISFTGPLDIEILNKIVDILS